MIKGIDVSKWQGKIDWAKVKASGIKFAILKAGSIYGKDSCFDINYKNAKSNGINVGAYFFSYAKNITEIQKEADIFLSYLKGKQFEMPVYLDIEDKSQTSLSKDVLTDMVITFCDKIEKAGYYTGVYTYYSFFKNNLNMDKIKRFTIWLAHYTTKTDFTGHDIWQYSSEGKVNGINGNVDMNIIYKDFSSVIANNYLNGFSKPIIQKVKEIKPVIKNTMTKVIKKIVPAKTIPTFKIGDTVIVLKPINYDNGKPFRLWASRYAILEINGNRAVIGIKGVVTSAIDIKNIKKV